MKAATQHHIEPTLFHKELVLSLVISLGKLLINKILDIR